MSEPNDGGGPPPTPAQIVAREERLGHYAWTGPQGNIDAWQLHADWWNQTLPNLSQTITDVSVGLGKLG